VTPEQRDEAVKIAFQRVFGTTKRSREQLIVWAWMAKFCRKNQSTYEQNDRDHALREGRREVLVEIERRLFGSEPTVDQILQHDGDHTNDD
jgi:hypothetical protein